MDSKEKSEKAAIRSLIEISQKENFYDSGNSDNELDPWVYCRNQEKKVNVNVKKKPLATRPSTATGKPPRSTSRHESRFVKDNKNKSSMVKRICLVAPTGQTFIMKPPIPNRYGARSTSLRNERENFKSSIERNPSNDINFSFRRKMNKYRLFRESFEKEKREGLSLINFPRVAL
jgi:hypothetical protein